MPENRVSAVLGEADRKAVLDAIETIRTKLSFLVDLSPEQRRSLPKMGDKSRAFVAKALAPSFLLETPSQKAGNPRPAPCASSV